MAEECPHKGIWFDKSYSYSPTGTWSGPFTRCSDCGIELNIFNRPIEVNMDAQILRTGKKKDEGKPRIDLVSSIAIVELSKVLAFGCKKYDTHNWRLGIAWSRVIAATLRHIFSWLGGQDKDPETGFSHLAHAFCCIMFLLEYEETRKEFDDRYKRER